MQRTYAFPTDKAQIKALIEKGLSPGEPLVGFFMAQRRPPIWLYLLIGPLAALSIRMYLVGVTDKRLHFHKLNLMGKVSAHDTFTFGEIKSVKFGRGLLTVPMAYVFPRGRKLKLHAQKVGLERVAKIDEKTVTYISQNIKAA